jgi:hypothetical protein
MPWTDAPGSETFSRRWPGTPDWDGMPFDPGRMALTQALASQSQAQPMTIEPALSPAWRDAIERAFAPPPPTPNPASDTFAPSDIANAAWSGLEQGAARLVGTPGDVLRWARDEGHTIGDQMRSISNEPPIADNQVLDPLGLNRVVDFLPTSQDVEKWAGIQPYKPKTTLGNYAETISSYLPRGALAAALAGL